MQLLNKYGYLEDRDKLRFTDNIRNLFMAVENVEDPVNAQLFISYRCHVLGYRSKAGDWIAIGKKCAP